MGGSMTGLAAALLVLLAGPAIHALTGRKGLGDQASGVMEGFLLVSLGALLLLHLIPDAWVHAGWWGLGVMVAAFAVSRLVRRSAQPRTVSSSGPDAAPPRRLPRWSPLATSGMAALGLWVHAGVDGAALRSVQDGFALSMAVILHRLPMSLFIWFAVTREQGPRAAAWMLTGLGLATLIGFACGPFEGTFAVGILNALVSGLVLHVVVHPLTPGAAASGMRWSRGVGAGLGFTAMMSLLWLLALESPPGLQSGAMGWVATVLLLAAAGFWVARARAPRPR